MLEGSCYKSPEWNPKQWVIGAWVGVGTSGVGYTSTYGYDPNGNITNLTRKDRAGVSFDNLSYTYTDPTATETAITNRLDHITDGVSNNTQTYDLKTQSAVNYTYDQIGYLTADNTEGISSITWNASGKVTKVVKPTVETSFLYDGLGNRVRKFVDKTGTTNDVNTYYVRDASGNVMSTYEKIGANGDLKQIEAPIYGSDRLGMEKPNNLIRYNDINNDLVSTTETMFKRTLGLKQYELKDHLGNVRVVLGDKKIRTGTGLTYPFKPEVVSYSNYYPFGMQMQENNQMAPGGDTWQNAITGYRYGYNGKEEDNEVHGEGNSYDYGARILDVRVGRWLSGDPLEAKYPFASTYNYALNTPIWAKDPDGKLVLFVKGYTFGCTGSYGERYTLGPMVGEVRNRYEPVFTRNDLQNDSRADEWVRQYWGGMDNDIMKKIGDDNVLYADGTNGAATSAEDRYEEGVLAGFTMLERIKAGDIVIKTGETIKIVGHSQGVAYSAGMSKVLINAGYTVESLYAIAPKQPEDTKIPAGVQRVVQYWSGFDFIAPQGKGAGSLVAPDGSAYGEAEHPKSRIYDTWDFFTPYSGKGMILRNWWYSSGGGHKILDNKWILDVPGDAAIKPRQDSPTGK